jgi:hypothetical protein
MTVMQQSPSRGLALMRYFASVLFALMVIVVCLKVAIDHWPCEFLAKGACLHATDSGQ